MFSMKLTKTHGNFWATGTYDDATVRFTAHGARDLGSASRMFDFSENTYAGKSFYDRATDRQILFTWLGTPAYATGMAGVQTLPREVLVDTDGVRIRTPPVAELQRLRTGHQRLENMSVASSATHSLLASEGGSLEILARLCVPTADEFDCAIILAPAAHTRSPGGGIGVSRAAAGGPVVAYILQGNGQSRSSPLPSTVDLDQPVLLQLFLDQGIVEGYWNEGRAVATTALPGSFGGGVSRVASSARQCNWDSLDQSYGASCHHPGGRV